MSEKRVVVTGLGAITPLGNSLETYWENLLAGKSGAAGITRFDASCFKTRFACEVKDFDPKEFIDRKDARKMDLFTQFAMVAADEALADSGLLESDADKEKIGVIWASGIGGLGTFQEQVADYTRRGEGNENYKFSPFFIPKMISDIASGHISIKHGLGGPNFAVVSACASSTNSMIDAYLYIKAGTAKAIVTGGSEAAVTESGLGGFGSMRALSMRNDDPQAASRPFDQDRDGFVLGEGAGGLILEDLDHALARGAKIYAEVVGFGASADAYHLTAPHPDGHGASRAMKMALDTAGLELSDIDYINVHGTSTPLGDVAELKAIQAVFGEAAYDLNISSTKSMTGHLLGAAGAVEGIACILAILNNEVPPTINNAQVDEAIDSRFNLTVNKKQSRPVRAALSNTFGFGGHNATVIFKKYED